MIKVSKYCFEQLISRQGTTLQLKKSHINVNLLLEFIKKTPLEVDTGTYGFCSFFSIKSEPESDSASINYELNEKEKKMDLKSNQKRLDISLISKYIFLLFISF